MLGDCAILWSVDEEGPIESESLRQRKKRLMRKLISDTATEMFLQRGFDAVRVTEVAAACEVSEKTVYNYFPTKESLILDMEEETAAGLRRALGPGTAHQSPIDATVAMLESDIRRMFLDFSADEEIDLTMIRRFGELVESTPSLRAAQRDMADRLVEVAAELLAERAGVNPDDPEPQIAANAIMGLWRIQFRAMSRYAEPGRSAEEIEQLVLADVQRAARLVDTGLWSFGVMVQGQSGQLAAKAAADAANDARKQVMTALKQAREAWRTLAAEHDRRPTEDEMRAIHDRLKHQQRDDAVRHRDEAVRGRDDSRSRREEAALIRELQRQRQRPPNR
jgi:AcrR family transcriptional regulator